MTGEKYFAESLFIVTPARNIKYCILTLQTYPFLNDVISSNFSVFQRIGRIKKTEKMDGDFFGRGAPRCPKPH